MVSTWHYAPPSHIPPCCVLPFPTQVCLTLCHVSINLATPSNRQTWLPFSLTLRRDNKDVYIFISDAGLLCCPAVLPFWNRLRGLSIVQDSLCSVSQTCGSFKCFKRCLSMSIKSLASVVLWAWSSFFIRLHTISSQPNTIVSLSRLFECLVQTRAPEAWYSWLRYSCLRLIYWSALTIRDLYYYFSLHCWLIGIAPLRIAFTWICHAFVACGALPMTEVNLFRWYIITYTKIYIWQLVYTCSWLDYASLGSAIGLQFTWVAGSSRCCHLLCSEWRPHKVWIHSRDFSMPYIFYVGI